MAAPRVSAVESAYETFGGGLVRYLSARMGRARELLCLTDCEPLGLAELARLCPELEEALKCDRADYLGGGLDARVRGRVAELYTTLAPEEVRLANGAGYALLRVMERLLRPGDHVVVHVPAFPPLYTIPRHLGCEVTPWRADPDRGWRLDLNVLSDSLQARTRLVVVSFPHNPTGYEPSAEELGELVDVARGRGVHLLCDEVYRAVPSPRPAVADGYEKGISVGGVSKLFGLPGARVGWIATHDEALLASLDGAASTGTETGAQTGNVLGHLIAEAALANRAAILQRNGAIVSENRARFQSFLQEHRESLRCDGPMAAPVVFPRLLGEGLRASAFCEMLLEETGTLAVPSEAIDFGEAHVRIGLGRRSFPVGLDRLSGFLSRRRLAGAPMA